MGFHKHSGAITIYCSFCSLPFFLFHEQRGSEDVMNFLSVEAANNRVKSILLLTPCHSTPYYSILHRNLPMRSMDCSPRYAFFWFLAAQIHQLVLLWWVSSLPFILFPCVPALSSEDRSMPDESDRFMMDPSGFASDLAKNWSKPSHIVLFDSEERQLKEFLSSHSFKEVTSPWHWFEFCFGLVFFCWVLRMFVLYTD